MKTQGPLLVDKQTSFQKVQIGKNKFWGTVLYLDDVLNVAERDEFVYHEMIVHVPMMMHPNPKKVLIIGGGDGGSARELMKHQGLEKCVMIDIDGVVVEECRKHLPGLNNGAFDDPRLELIIGDGIDYVKKAEDNFWDVIIVDSTDPTPEAEGCGDVLFTKEFYENCYRILAKNGVMTTQSAMPMRMSGEMYVSCLRNLQHAFTKDKTWIYLIPTDTYNGQTSFGCCFKDDVHPTKLDKQRVKDFEKLNKLKYYNYKVHKAAFCLPNFLKDTLLSDGKSSY